MEYIAGSKDFKFENTAVTLGKFDGLHLGHKQLIHLTASYKEQGLKAVIFSFLLHPENLFSGKEFEVIYTEEEKLYHFRKLGIDALISYPFNQQTRSMSPEDFIRDILVNQLGVKAIIVGNDFRFGYQRRGDVELLKQYADIYGYEVIACEKKDWNGDIISSSAIRSALKEGNLASANAMLGQAYSILGKVEHGRKLGRTIGIPTVNLIPPSSKLLPPCGVYATKVIVKGVPYLGATNIGYKPTVGEEKFIGIETFILDFNGDLYGEQLEIEFYEFIRPELKFDSLEELTEKMKEDIEVTQRYFEMNASDQ